MQKAFFNLWMCKENGNLSKLLQILKKHLGRPAASHQIKNIDNDGVRLTYVVWLTYVARLTDVVWLTDVLRLSRM